MDKKMVWILMEETDDYTGETSPIGVYSTAETAEDEADKLNDRISRVRRTDRYYYTLPFELDKKG